MARRKTRLTLTEEQGEEDVCFQISEPGAWLSGGGDEDLICCRCDRLLIRGISREDVCGVLKRAIDAERAPEHIPNRGTAVEHRPFPLVVVCDCGTMNRVWPIIPA